MSQNFKGILLLIIASFLAALLFLLYYFSASPKRKILYFNITIFAVFVMTVTVIFAYSNYETIQKSRSAIIFSPKSEIKNAPSLNSEPVFELHEGTKVTILDELSNWKKIKLADGKIQASTTAPVLVNAASFKLDTGVRKLQDIAKLNDISLMVPVTFNVEFKR